MTRRTVAVVTPPAAMPVTVAEVKAYIRLDTSDEDALIETFIDAATENAEAYTRRAFITRTLRMSLDLGCSRTADSLGEGVYELPVTALYGALPRVVEMWPQPIKTITGVRTYDTSDTESTFDAANYKLNADGSRFILTSNASWPSNLRPEAAAVITFTAGYGTADDVPAAIKTAIMAHAGKMFDERSICELPETSQRLLRPFRIMDGLAHG